MVHLVVTWKVSPMFAMATLTVAPCPATGGAVAAVGAPAIASFRSRSSSQSYSNGERFIAGV